MKRTPQSLKAFLPLLAPLLGMGVNALYERQRELVRKGLLKEPTGRGPGSGSPVDTKSVATLVAAVLISDNLSDIRDASLDTLQSSTRAVVRALRHGNEITYDRPRGAFSIRATLQAETIDRIGRLIESAETSNG